MELQNIFKQLLFSCLMANLSCLFAVLLSQDIIIMVPVREKRRKGERKREGQRKRKKTNHWKPRPRRAVKMKLLLVELEAPLLALGGFFSKHSGGSPVSELIIRHSQGVAREFMASLVWVQDCRSSVVSVPVARQHQMFVLRSAQRPKFPMCSTSQSKQKARTISLSEVCGCLLIYFISAWYSLIFQFPAGSEHCLIHPTCCSLSSPQYFPISKSCLRVCSPGTPAPCQHPFAFGKILILCFNF